MKSIQDTRTGKVYFVPDIYLESFLILNELSDLISTGNVTVKSLGPLWSEKKIFDLLCDVSVSLSYHTTFHYDRGVFTMRLVGTKMYLQIVVENKISGNVRDGKFKTIIGSATMYNGIYATPPISIEVEEKKETVIKCILNGHNKKFGSRTEAFWNYINGKILLFKRRCHQAFGGNP